jgi:hypothetical protein
MTSRELLVYTDGACIPNPGRGGWDIVILQSADELRKLSGKAQEQELRSIDGRKELNQRKLGLFAEHGRRRV